MGSGETILIVDDEINLRTTLSAILQRAGYDIIASSSFPEAIQYLKERCFDLVFLDLKVLEPNGVNLLRELNKIRPGIPVIMLTTTAYDEAAAQSNGVEAVAYLLKPIDPARIVACAEEVLKKKPMVEQHARLTRKAHAAPGEKAF